MDWLPISDRLFDFWPFAVAGVAQRNDDEGRPEMEIHSPGDRWGWMRVGGTSTLLITQFIVVAIVYWQFYVHEERAAVRAAQVKAAHDAAEDKLLRELTAKMDMILANQGRLLETMISANKERELQTYVMTLDDRQKRELNLMAPEELIRRRR